MSVLLNFFYRTSNLLQRAAAVYQMCTTGSVVESSRSSRLAFSPIPSLIFTGSQKCEIWPRSSTPLFFEPPSFRNEATHRCQSSLFGAAMVDLCSFKIWWSLVPLSGVEYRSTPPFVKKLRITYWWLINLAQMWYIVWLHDTGSFSGVQGQGVKGQGHRSKVIAKHVIYVFRVIR